MNDSDARAKRYNRIRLILSGCRIVFTAAVLLVCILTPLSRTLADAAVRVTAQPYGTLLVYAAMLGLCVTILLLPLDFYSGFVLEHRYGLSTQSFGRWVVETAKEQAVGAVLMAPLLLLLYWFLRNRPGDWWLLFAAGMVAFSLLLGVLAPKIILPLFYTLTPVESGALRDSLTRMAAAVGLSISGVYVFDMSRNTRKANAAFTGLGKSKRVLLGDTLMQEFDTPEIEAVFAHELGHYRHRHLTRRLIVGAVSSLAGMALAGWALAALVPALQFRGIADPAALPLLALILTGYGLLTVPLNNAYSRRHERQADAWALQSMGDAGPVISGFRKLRDLNLADAEPNPWMERLFHSHPSIGRRIRFAETWQQQHRDTVNTEKNQKI